MDALRDVSIRSFLAPGPCLLVALGLCAGCVSFRDDLARAEALYVDARYEEAEVWFVALAPELRDAVTVDRLRYNYLRGMTAYRLEARGDALHHLALARELLERIPAGALPRPQAAQLRRVLDELTPRGPTHRATPRPSG
ncbi:MAG: hypothetical protein AAF447_07330 [Myxococcota bacterium]